LHIEWVLETVLDQNLHPPPARRRYGLFVRPDQPWLVRGLREYLSDDPAHWSSEYVIEYEESNDTWPRVKVLDCYMATKRSEWVPWRRMRYDVAEYRKLTSPLPEQAFTLSHYGLPEPKTISPDSPRAPAGEATNNPVPPPESRRSWLWLWLIIAAVILTAAIVYVRYRRAAWRAADEAAQLGYRG
jgi:hypothetical protein